VLFDLPWNPVAVEQRIGRLDRIGRQLPVEIVYFRPPGGIAADAVRLFERLGLFREPLAGVEPELARVDDTLAVLADDPTAGLSDAASASLVGEVHAARTRIREAAYQQLHRDPFKADMAAAVLARVPAHLDALTQDVVVTACARLGFTLEHTRGRRVFAIELGSDALVDSLPGVRSGSTYVGSFDREEAVEDETLDFFASGHLLVEGILAHFEDSVLGRAARLELAIGSERGDGLAAIYKDGPDFDVVAFDAQGRARADWAAALRRRPLAARRPVDDPPGRTRWTATVSRLGALLDPARTPHALVALSVRPAP
jgi:ATP-dependent helicase HepA